MNRIRNTVLFSFLLVTGKMAHSQPANDIPKIIEENGRHALLVDGKPFLILGGQAHNSSAWPGMMPQVWSAAEKMHLNTLEVPIYWEQVEPAEGQFDYSLIDTLILQARNHNMKLVLLWFATWKNGSNHYMPGWMKKQAAKYPNIMGKDGKPVDSPSPHFPATLEADKKAFAAVMRYLKKADTEHTVIMVQVENEPGSWDTVRDYSPTAEKLIAGKVPEALLQATVLNQLPHEGTKGSWKEVFGANADEYFHAWSVAHFIGQVAAAGRAEYNLPLYANAALRDPLTNPPATTYESGGPTDNVIAIWKAAAPALDLVAPDIYLQGSERIMKVLELYARPDNPLFVPEIAYSPLNAKYIYEVIARGGIGFAPFGIDDNGQGSPDSILSRRARPYGQEYAFLSPMMRELAKWSFDGKVMAAIEREDHGEQRLNLGKWEAIITFGGRGRATKPANAEAIGKALIVKLSDHEFLLGGTLCHFAFKPLGADSGKAWQYLKVEEGWYDHGVFHLLRIRNGDETDWGGPQIGDTPVLLRVSLVTR